LPLNSPGRRPGRAGAWSSSWLLAYGPPLMVPKQPASSPTRLAFGVLTLCIKECLLLARPSGSPKTLPGGSPSMGPVPPGPCPDSSPGRWTQVPRKMLQKNALAVSSPLHSSGNYGSPKFPAKCYTKMPWQSQVSFRVQESKVPPAPRPQFPTNYYKKCLGNLKSISEFKKVIK
jgi:hypothetical protein